jgi:transposase
VKGLPEALAERDARVLFLPPYSPDLNPIEQVFSKVKNELRRRRLRTVREVEDACGQSLEWVTRDEVHNYYRNAGYQSGE